MIPTLQVVCAWCDRVIVEGDADGEVSHGMCAECAVGMRADMAAHRQGEPERLDFHSELARLKAHA